ncbi:hypothetical protein HG421_01340 [Xanthomonas campestris pv. badrii]|uniref:Fimbrial protein n=1 Tax=Xanthomonas campestris pv. badrii TaxID=149696 RepID=A0A7Z2V7W0_XANCA|nr:fimbrial protein [Xanthomonas campestris]MCC4605473.1 hypothetical protein [Xanthomonas campestris pv. parthenii]QJD66498.1 hypothetical protein HG421_01340 [Xanthomonas campestris pv. badrii]
MNSDISSNCFRVVTLGISLFIGPAAAAPNAWITVKAQVTPVCTLSISESAIDLGSISALTLESTAPGTALSGMTKPIGVTSSCVGTNLATLLINTTDAVKDGYIVPAPGDVIRFGIDSEQGPVRLDWSTKAYSMPITQSGTSTYNKFTVYAVAGAAPDTSTSAGTYTATIQFTLSPG